MKHGLNISTHGPIRSHYKVFIASVIPQNGCPREPQDFVRLLACCDTTRYIWFVPCWFTFVSPQQGEGWSLKPVTPRPFRMVAGPLTPTSPWPLWSTQEQRVRLGAGVVCGLSGVKTCHQSASGITWCLQFYNPVRWEHWKLSILAFVLLLHMCFIKLPPRDVFHSVSADVWIMICHKLSLCLFWLLSQPPDVCHTIMATKEMMNPEEMQSKQISYLCQWMQE